MRRLLASASPMSRTTAVRSDRRPLEGAQVLTLMWRSIETFPANVAARGSEEVGPDALAAHRTSWRRLMVDALAACAALPGSRSEVYGCVERLLSDLPPFLRSDRQADLDTFQSEVDIDALVAQMGAEKAAFFALPPGTSEEDARILTAWRRQMWMGLCEARADRRWSSTDDPRRQAFLTRCRQDMGFFRAFTEAGL